MNFITEKKNILEAINTHYEDVLNNWVDNHNGLSMAGSDECKCCRRANEKIAVASNSKRMYTIMEEWLPEVKW